jgi:hypothetical protein
MEPVAVRTIIETPSGRYAIIRDPLGWTPTRRCGCALGPHWHTIARTQRTRRAAEIIIEKEAAE